MTGSVECQLESANDLAALLASLTLREKDPRDQRVLCEASPNGLKFIAQSAGKDVEVLGWIFKEVFKSYAFRGSQDEVLHLKLPVATLISCLTIFSDRAALLLKYSSEMSHELRLTLEEDGAVTECCVKTLVLDDVPAQIGSFLTVGERPSTFRMRQPDAWYLALSEFVDLDAPDVLLKITLRSQTVLGSAAAVVLRAASLTSDVEVELPQAALEDYELINAEVGEVTYSYLLSSVLAGCLKAAKESKAVKVRFNSNGTMSNQFVMKGRGQQLYCEALVCPIADFQATASRSHPAANKAIPAPSGNQHISQGWTQIDVPDESLGF